MEKKKASAVRQMKQRGAVDFRIHFRCFTGSLCMFPQNTLLSENPSLSWGIYRNIQFAVLGRLVAYQFFKDRKIGKHFKFAWTAVTLLFLFYLTVIIFADDAPIAGMLMIPKTVYYIELVIMGRKEIQNV